MKQAAGNTYARSNGLKLKLFNANWKEEGKAAGPIRNAKMAKYADILILIWDGKSKGSASMLSEAKKNNLKIISVIT